VESLVQELIQQWATVKEFFAFDTSRLHDTDMMVRGGIQVLLLVGSAFFSGSETALFSLSRLDLQRLRRDRHGHSETLHELLDQPRRLIISILCGNELVNIAAAANMTGILVALYGGERAGWISIMVMVPVLLLFGEVTPKTIAIADPVRVSAGLVARPMAWWVKIVSPLVWLIRGVADRTTTLIVGEETAAENILQIDEFRTLVEQGEEGGVLNATERALIYNLLEAGDTEVVEIMTPRTRTEFLNVDMSVSEMVERFREFRHPRVPVFRLHRDNLVGFLHAEDVLRLILDEIDLSKLTPEEIVHPPVVVPLTKKVDEMFAFFQDNQARAAMVLNEFGGVEGLVTLKDVLSFIFGQISGQVTGQEHYRERDENTYEIAGDMKLTDFNNLTNFGIEDPRMTTIGGVAFRHLDRLPAVGDSVSVEGIAITVQLMDEHRVSRVRVSRGSGVGKVSTDGKEEPQEVAQKTKQKKAAKTRTKAGEEDTGKQSAGHEAGDEKAKAAGKRDLKAETDPSAVKMEDGAHSDIESASSDIESASSDIESASSDIESASNVNESSNIVSAHSDNEGANSGKDSAHSDAKSPVILPKKEA
jgi:CBS domain containing-hemolysin-like protein